MTNRILTCPVPSNINPLSPNGYYFSIQRLPEITYFCQEVNLPSVGLGMTNVATPFIDYSVAGDKLDFGELTVQFMIDAEMKNYKAIFDWMQGLGFPESYDQYTTQVSSPTSTSEVSASTSDASLVILGNNNVPIRYVHFVDCLPLSLESLTFTSNSQDVQYLIGNVTFRYSYYKFVD